MPKDGILNIDMNQWVKEVKGRFRGSQMKMSAHFTLACVALGKNDLGQHQGRMASVAAFVDIRCYSVGCETGVRQFVALRAPSGAIGG